MLDGRASAGASVDSARQNLAATFVNAFVNAGFGQVYCILYFKILYVIFVIGLMISSILQYYIYLTSHPRCAG